MIDYDSFSHCHLTDIFFRYLRGSKRVKFVKYIFVLSSTCIAISNNSNVDFNILMLKTHLSRCKFLWFLIYVRACARTINITFHNIADGVPENSAQECAQVVAMAIKDAELTFQYSKHICPAANSF